MNKSKIRKVVFATLIAMLLVVLGAYLLYGVMGVESDHSGRIQNEMEISKREELQRYLGYETLLPRYLTLPFDVSIGVNQIGPFVDVGFLLFMFLPILILYIIRRNKWYSILFISSMILYLFLSISNSIVVDGVKKSKVDTMEKLISYPDTYSFSDAPVDYMIVWLYTQCKTIYGNGVSSFVDLISGNHDYVTYPILLFLFLGICMLTYLYTWEKEKVFSIFIMITTIYTFYWITLSSGIIWYGYLLLVLCMMIILYGVNHLKTRKDSFARFIKYTFYCITSMWILTGFTSKVSNVDLYGNPKDQGKHMVYPGTFKYTLGINETESKVLDDFYPFISVVFKRLNADKNSLVYKIGTSFSIFISHNDRRVFPDNQLGTFALMQKKYKTRDEITDVLKASNFKFILVDLYTATLDNTPEQTLVKKYTALREYLANNPRLRLAGTDRMVKRTNEAGETKVVRHMFGQEIVFAGSYAVFEIL